MAFLFPCSYILTLPGDPCSLVKLLYCNSGDTLNFVLERWVILQRQSIAFHAISDSVEYLMIDVLLT